MCLTGRQIPPLQGRQGRGDQLDLCQTLHRLQNVPPARTRTRAATEDVCRSASNIELVRQEVGVPAREERKEDVFEAAFKVIGGRGGEAVREVGKERGQVAEL